MFDLLARVRDDCYISLLYTNSYSSDSPKPIIIYSTKPCVEHDVQSFRILLVVRCVTCPHVIILCTFIIRVESTMTGYSDRSRYRVAGVLYDNRLRTL